VTFVLTREQQATIAAMERWRLPSAYTPVYVRREIELATRDAARERCRRRQRLAHQLAIAIGWRTP
jgi:hypothetical protein